MPRESVVPAVVPIRTASRGRSRSRSADTPGTRTMAPLTRQPVVQQAPSMLVVEDMETKMANALVVAMQKMGLAGPATGVPMVLQPPSNMAPQMLVNTATHSMALPKIDRSRQRG